MQLWPCHLCCQEWLIWVPYPAYVPVCSQGDGWWTLCASQYQGCSYIRASWPQSEDRNLSLSLWEIHLFAKPRLSFSIFLKWYFQWQISEIHRPAWSLLVQKLSPSLLVHGFSTLLHSFFPTWLMVSYVPLCYVTAQLIRELECCKSPLPQANLCVTVHKVNS